MMMEHQHQHCGNYRPSSSLSLSSPRTQTRIEVGVEGEHNHHCQHKSITIGKAPESNEKNILINNKRASSSYQHHQQQHSISPLAIASVSSSSQQSPNLSTSKSLELKHYYNHYNLYDYKTAPRTKSETMTTSSKQRFNNN